MNVGTMMYELLRDIEWSADLSIGEECPVCGETKRDGHYKDCALGIALYIYRSNDPPRKGVTLQTIQFLALELAGLVKGYTPTENWLRDFFRRQGYEVVE